MKTILLAAALAAFGSVRSAGQPALLENLLPRPASIEARDGTADASACARVSVRTGAVAGAPDATRNEAYRLEIGPAGVTITAPTEKGVRHARTTLAQLQGLAGGGSLPAAVITDWPAMRWRGLLLDCGRNYVALPLLLDVIDFLARYKLNVFHWHLADNHGWRLESKRYPQLQRPNAFARQTGRYYTQAEFKAVLAAAAARGVTVVPELDVPGHSAAFRRAFGLEKMDSPGVEKIVCELIDELCALAPAETMPVIHLGTDEVRRKDEQVPDAWYATWAQRVADNGRTVMGWWPGHALSCSGRVLQQTWYETRPPTGPYVDAGCCYIDSFSPWSLLAQATFKKVGGCYPGTDPNWIEGGEVEAWHDDPIADSEDVARDNALFPAMLLFSDMLWRGNVEHATNLVFAPPAPGKDGFARMADLERRALAQRDGPLADFRHPLQLVRQTDMRWTMSDETGKVIAENIPCATVYVQSPRAEWGYPGFVSAETGTVTLTAEFVSPVAREAGAFIELNEYHRSGARASYGLPPKGQWNRYGATVKLNGKTLAPPDWNHADAGMTQPLKERPWSDECAWIRPPTPIRIEKGANRVEIRLPKTDGRWYWSASFVPVEGTREHPREIPDLVWRSVRTRPYEFTWASRSTDEFPPLCRLEGADGWRVETERAEASLTTARDRALFGDSVARLRYRATGKAPKVRLRIARPIPAPDGFDTATLWVYGNNIVGKEGYRNSSTPVPMVDIAADFAGKDGKPFSLPLGTVRHREWFLQTGVVTNGAHRMGKAPDGLTFLGFTVTGGTNEEPREIDITSFCAFTDPQRPLNLKPRAKRGVQVFPEAPQGLNTGEGRLPFPNRPETIVPPSATLSKALEFRLPKDPLVWDDLAFRYGGGDWIPLAKGGGLFPREKAVGARVTFRREGNSLVCDIARPEPGVESVRFGAAAFPAGTKAYGWPFLTGRWMTRWANPLTPVEFEGRIRPKTAVLTAGGSTLLVSAMLDWTQSNASSPIGGDSAPTNCTQLCAGTFYLPKTDGRLNGCFERFVWTFAERAADVFPAIPNPPSPFRRETAAGSWTAFAARNREKDTAYWRAVKAAGMDHIIITDHETGWRDGNESFTFRTRPAPGKGGDEGQRQYARILIDELGFRYGPYNNFTDYAPVNENWSLDRASRYGDGRFGHAWNRCYAPKPAWAVGMCERLAPSIQRKFHFSTAYCDVHTCVTPWGRNDYDARSPGAGTFAQVFYAFGEIMLLQKAAWNGPVYSEGGIQWIYSGLTDGNYGQDGEYDFFDSPWLVDFDLMRIHPLCNNFGMGAPYMFYGQKKNATFQKANPDRWLDRFIAATLAFGHAGFFISARNPSNLAQERNSYFPVQAIAARYCMADAVEIRYGGADGRLLTTEEALANGDVALNRIRVTYSDGTVVAVNGSMDGTFDVDVLGERHVLPPNGWYARTADGEVVTYCLEKDGKRIRYAKAPGYREPYEYVEPGSDK